MLSDEEFELASALDRLAADKVASDIAEADLGLNQQLLNNEPTTTRIADAD